MVFSFGPGVWAVAMQEKTQRIRIAFFALPRASWRVLEA
jgi:hypothetical protein